MKALDTNAVIRFLVKDGEKEAQAVRRILLKAEKEGNSFFITCPVVLETMWVLSSVYEYEREDIVCAVENLLSLPVLTIENHKTLTALCHEAQISKVELPDLLIGLVARDAGCDSTLTFDQKATESSGLFTLIK